jgi:hypothetical protein
MSQTRLGTSNGPWLVEETLENSTQGSNSTQTWEGSAAECSAKRLALISAGATKLAYSSKGDGNYVLKAEWPVDINNAGSSSYVDTLELDTNLVQRSVYQSPIYRKKFSDYNSTTGYSRRANITIPIVKKAVQYLQNLQPTIAKTDKTDNKQEISVRNPTYKVPNLAGVMVDFPTAERAAEAYLYNRLQDAIDYGDITVGEANTATKLFYEVGYMDTTTFWEFGTVFRRTVTASVPSAVNANFAGVGMIWTSAEVSAFEGIGSGGWFTLPVGKQWIKDKPRVQKSYGQKTQLSYNYTEIVSASALLYEAYGTATLIHT